MSASMIPRVSTVAVRGTRGRDYDQAASFLINSLSTLWSTSDMLAFVS